MHGAVCLVTDTDMYLHGLPGNWVKTDFMLESCHLLFRAALDELQRTTRAIIGGGACNEKPFFRNECSLLHRSIHADVCRFNVQMSNTFEPY